MTNLDISSIKNKSQVVRYFVFTFIPLAILSGSIIAFLFYKEVKSRQLTRGIKETSRLETQKDVICYYIQNIASDVLAISKHYELSRMLNGQDSSALKSIAEEFLSFCRIKKIYDQVRFLDEYGMERVRINYNNGKPGIVPQNELQPKGKRYYFIDIFQLSGNEVFVSPLDLNIERGQLEIPIKPMIRFGTPVFDKKGRKRGVLVLNYFGSHLLNTLKNISKEGEGETLLLNSDGYYLLSPRPADEWGFMYENKKDRTFARSFPDEWKEISRADVGQFYNANGMYTFTTIRPFTEAQISSTGSGEPYTPSKKMLDSSKYYWKLISHIPSKSFMLTKESGLIKAILIYGAMLIIFGFTSIFVALSSVKRKQAEDEVREHRDHLKQLVEQRTAELINVNSELQNDINARKMTETKLRESEEKYRSMMEAMDDAAYICSNDFRIDYMNPAMIKRTGYDASGERCSSVIHGIDEKCPWCVHQKVMEGEHIKTEVISPKDMQTYSISNSPIFHLDGSISKLTIFRDITEFKKIEAQLQQAQKLESVGRLAGGVAHDYNNALNIIIGFSELALCKIQSNNELEDYLNEIIKAAHNAADITRQLLAFARKQTVDPKVINLNENIENMLKMISRLIGENIELIWSPGSELWLTKIDPSQLNQILANLCVNARDAIKGVGKIIIKTKNITIDEVISGDSGQIKPGDFVHLTVSDNGSGIEKQNLKNIFEPFFSTKGIDKGTGLGLATVYGIVKQNSGFINVYSEPGHGTTFSIYLPRIDGKPAETRESFSNGSLKGHGETILLVEDDLPNLRLTRDILASLGYNILASHTPTKALKLAEEYSGRIHLLITDIIMPEMDGREMSVRISALHPDIKCIFISGYTADVIAERGIIEEGVILIHKPFTKIILAETVRKVLGN